MKRSSIVMTAIAALVVGVAAYLLLQQTPSLPRDPLALVPADAFAFARIKASHVVKSQAWKRLVVARDEARGIERVEEECGFNPFAELEEIVVFARPAPKGGMPRFAFAARGPLKHEAIIDCLRKITGKGGSALQTEEVEGITTVRSGKGGSRAAFIGRDGVIGGDGESVRALINTIHGKAQNAASDPLFRDLFAAVQQGSDVALVARMPDDLVPTMRMLSRVAGGAFSALTELRAVGISATSEDERIHGGAVLVAPNEVAAQSVVEIVATVRARLLDIPGIGLTPANAVLNSIKMEAIKDRATITGAIKVSSAELLLDLLPALSAFTGGDDAGARAAAAAAQLLGDQPGTNSAANPAAPVTPSPAAGDAGAPLPGTPTVESLAPPAAKKKPPAK